MNLNPDHMPSFSVTWMEKVLCFQALAIVNLTPPFSRVRFEISVLYDWLTYIVNELAIGSCFPLKPSNTSRQEGKL